MDKERERERERKCWLMIRFVCLYYGQGRVEESNWLGKIDGFEFCSSKKVQTGLFSPEARICMKLLCCGDGAGSRGVLSLNEPRLQWEISLLPLP